MLTRLGRVGAGAERGKRQSLCFISSPMGTWPRKVWPWLVGDSAQDFPVEEASFKGKDAQCSRGKVLQGLHTLHHSISPNSQPAPPAGPPPDFAEPVQQVHLPRATFVHPKSFSRAVGLQPEPKSWPSHPRGHWRGSRAVPVPVVAQQWWLFGCCCCVEFSYQSH